jgi:hypothetical protein
MHVSFSTLAFTAQGKRMSTGLRILNQGYRENDSKCAKAYMWGRRALEGYRQLRWMPLASGKALQLVSGSGGPNFFQKMIFSEAPRGGLRHTSNFVPTRQVQLLESNTPTGGPFMPPNTVRCHYDVPPTAG